MSRRGTTEKRTAKSDPIHRNRLVNMVVNRIMKHGKKALAYQIFYRAAQKIQQTETNPVFVLREAIRRITPQIGVKARRKAGLTRQVPIEIQPRQAKVLAIRWLLEASRKRLGKNMAIKLSAELLDAAKGKGGAIRKKEETHRMAQANRVFAHLRFRSRNKKKRTEKGKEKQKQRAKERRKGNKERKEKTEIMIN